MTSRFSSSLCMYAVSSKPQYGANPFLAFRLPSSGKIHGRSYAAQQQSRCTKSNPATARETAIRHEYSAKAALTTIGSNQNADPINPARSTLPPPLRLPERDKSPTIFIYWFNIGRAYGSFYKEGVKAVWYNYKAARLLRERIQKSGAKDGFDAAQKGLIARSDWQVLQRNNHDIGKLPFFGLLVLVFGEWLPVLVPFMPGVVPYTCRIPKQVFGMRAKAEERRRISFRQGISEPSQEQMPDDRVAVAGRPADEAEWPMLDATYVRSLLAKVRDDQLHHLSSTLTLHSRIWDRLQLPPPAFLLRRNITRHLQGLAVDDKLLLKTASELPATTSVTAGLSPVELEEACADRGLDVLGKKETELSSSLSWWLKRQQDDKGRGRAVLTMLFRRPSAWGTRGAT